MFIKACNSRIAKVTFSSYLFQSALTLKFFIIAGSPEKLWRLRESNSRPLGRKMTLLTTGPPKRPNTSFLNEFLNKCIQFLEAWVLPFLANGVAQNSEQLNCSPSIYFSFFQKLDFKFIRRKFRNQSLNRFVRLRWVFILIGQRHIILNVRNDKNYFLINIHQESRRMPKVIIDKIRRKLF